MNVSSRVPGCTRNSGWQAVDAEIAANQMRLQPARSHSTLTQGRVDSPGPRSGRPDW
jgi:hypothetical protein